MSSTRRRRTRVQWRCPLWLAVLLLPLAPLFAIGALIFAVLFFSAVGMADFLEALVEVLRRWTREGAEKAK